MTELEYEKLASVNVSPSDNPASLPASMFSVSLALFKSDQLQKTQRHHVHKKKSF